MVHVRRTFTVSQPPAVVVAYLADFSNAVDWDPGTVTCTRVDPGPVEVGARWHNVSRILGSSTELDYRLERLDPDRVVLVGRNRTATSTDDIRVVGHADGAQVTYDSTVVLNGAAKLAAPVMRLALESLGRRTVVGIQGGVDAL